ncbi:MAG: thioredoxin-dependent thiol peroxidase [Rikenellaceae bacterium]|jgi:peroxiredoxin Q/BCP|nr:thioredoxin-dependent thiol peroxidase [Rikenellaceae bacterium]MBQ5679020.1 thioredoxin-dependent thiol peroxidase [Rikenellaceae bacterium]
MGKLKIGDKAPAFEVFTQNGDIITLDSLQGRRTILYFYPKDNTSGCTLEAKSMRDGKAALAEAGYDIYGVSPDSQRSHQNFCAKHELNFTLLSDTEKRMAEAFGVWVEKKMYGRAYMGIQRTTFIIDEQGVIEQIFDKVDTKNHYQQILDWHNTK